MSIFVLHLHKKSSANAFLVPQPAGELEERGRQQHRRRSLANAINLVRALTFVAARRPQGKGICLITPAAPSRPCGDRTRSAVPITDH